MNHPDFKHRAMPDGGDYENFSKMDLYVATMGKIEQINGLIDLMRLHFEFGQEDALRLSDSINMGLLNQISLGLADIEVVTTWAVNNFDLVKAGEQNDDQDQDDYLPRGDAESGAIH